MFLSWVAEMTGRLSSKLYPPPNLTNSSSLKVSRGGVSGSSRAGQHAFLSTVPSSKLVVPRATGGDRSRAADPGGDLVYFAEHGALFYFPEGPGDPNPWSSQNRPHPTVGKLLGEFILTMVLCCVLIT